MNPVSNQLPTLFLTKKTSKLQPTILLFSARCRVTSLSPSFPYISLILAT